MLTEVVGKLQKIQQELKAPKGQMNTYGGYKYRSCEDILEAVKPLLGKYGCSLTITDDIIGVGDRVYVKATAILWNIDNGETIENSAFAREAVSRKGMDDSQITGSASSYARKYALNGLFAIDDTKDADATNTHGKDEEIVNIENQKISDIKVTALAQMLQHEGIPEDKIFKLYKVKSLADITEKQYSNINANMKKIKEA